MSEAKTVAVGLISITLHDSASAQISCDHHGVRPIVVAKIGAAAGQRFYDELTKIHDALEAARAVLLERAKEGGNTTPAEFHLARVLHDLEITGDWQQTLAQKAGPTDGVFDGDPYEGPMNKKGDW